MQSSSGLPFCLSLSCFQGSNIPGSADQALAIEVRSTETTGAIMPTGPWHSSYFKEHGYSFWTEDNFFKVFTERYSHNSLDPVVRLYIDPGHKAVTIFEDNLHGESPSTHTLEIQNIYRALCLKAEIDPNIIEWMAMDVHDWTTFFMLQGHRQNNGLGQDDFYITPGHAADWETFSNGHHFQAAAKMIPGGEIDRIAVRSQQREAQVPGYVPINVECMMLSLKQPVSEDDDASMDSIGENILEIKIKNNLDAIAGYAEHVIATNTKKALLEAE